MEVNLYKPHKNQRTIHDSINNESFKYYVLNIGRQFGKSMLAENQCLYWALNSAHITIGWVAPTYKQAMKVFLEIEKAFSDSDLMKTNKSELTIKFDNRSTIQFFSSEKYNNIRGFTFDYLVCDEIAFQAEASWSEVLKATVLVKGKKVLLISTPRGKNHFYRMYLSGLNDVNKVYKSFKFTSYDNPLINPAEIDEAKANLPPHIFKQEYLGEFVDDSSVVFPKPIILNEAIKPDKNYAGVDVGRADDYTVVTIINSSGQMVDVQRFRHTSWENIVNQVAVIINKYNADTYVEVNGVGDPIFEMLRDKTKKVRPFVTTNKSKQDIIEQLIVDMQNGLIKFQNEDWLIQEFDVFTYDYNPKSKVIKYSAPAGFHDDGVMSVAFANKARKDLIHSGKYTVR